MSLTSQQQYQVLFAILEEGHRLANKFGLNEGVKLLTQFKVTLELTLPSEEASLKKFIEEKKPILFSKIAETFGLPQESVKKLKKLFDPNEKKLKKIIKNRDKKSDQEVLALIKAYAKGEAKDFLKEKCGVRPKEILEARAIFQEKLNSESFITSLKQTAEQLLNNPPKSYNFYGVHLNSLYKLLKIINGIDDERLVTRFASFFEKDNVNIPIIKAFFAVEKTEGYCRHSTLLVSILELLVKQSPSCKKITTDFIDTLPKTPVINTKQALFDKSGILTRNAFESLAENTLKMIEEFHFILGAATQDLATRKEAITALHTTPDIFLKAVCYFGIVSPLLKEIETQLAKEWDEQLCKTFRVELSVAFDIILGLKSKESLEKIKATSIICPALFELCTSSAVREKAEEFFLIFTQSFKKTTPIKKELPSRHQRRRSHSLDLGVATSSSEIERGDEEKPPLSKREVYTRERTISFYRQPPLDKLHSGATSSTKIVTKKEQSNTFESFFNDLLTSDREKATQFILSLVRAKIPKQYAWGVRALDLGADKNNSEIAKLLLEKLSHSEMLSLLKHLLSQESLSTWCRGNRLLYQLIQQFFEQKEGKDFRDLVWKELFSLNPFITKIKVMQRASIQGKPDNFDAGQTDIQALQSQFKEVLKNIIALLLTEKFPPLMKEFLKLAYIDLASKSTDANEVRRSFMAFILLRFVNASIIHRAMLIPEQYQKMWYQNILPGAIQSLCSSVTSMREGESGKRDLQIEVFDPITKDLDYRKELYNLIFEDLEQNLPEKQELPIEPIPEVSLTELNEMLKNPEFSGLHFKKTGLVVSPRREEPKVNVQTLFGSSKENRDENSAEPAKSVLK
ncbi:hypothetical protein [Legionella clemsonensis]|uniref:Uncharacterized protein n=1 Tax=Legionella clemsonensis TaxID=1867846 RepID=A0A222NZV4_9GAMM|nr:hypothetical protein [Legionella clemsonensis]ASQ45127.1 hypothetical protein clem_02830 [Legionella clemsonensis]